MTHTWTPIENEMTPAQRQSFEAACARYAERYVKPLLPQWLRGLRRRRPRGTVPLLTLTHPEESRAIQIRVRTDCPRGALPLLDEASRAPLLRTFDAAAAGGLDPLIVVFHLGALRAVSVIIAYAPAKGAPH